MVPIERPHDPKREIQGSENVYRVSREKTAIPDHSFRIPYAVRVSALKYYRKNPVVLILNRSPLPDALVYKGFRFQGLPEGQISTSRLATRVDRPHPRSE